MADLPPEHGSAEAEAGLLGIVARNSIVVSVVRWLRRLFLDLDSCASPHEMIRRMAICGLFLTPEAIRTPQACDACFAQQQSRRK
jgi:hypothetical protein